MVGWHILNGQDNECVHNFGIVPSWKTVLVILRRCDIDLKEKGCEKGRRMDLAQDHTQLLLFISQL
jgi:hypothetical protein